MSKIRSASRAARRAGSIASALVLMACAAGALAQAYPAKPVRWILGIPPGGSADFIARTFAEELSRQLGAPFVVENKPGANTNIASEMVARAAPDGYTLLLAGSFSHSVNPALFARLPFDPQKDFAPVAKLATLPTVFVVPQSLPVANLQEFIAYARREGDKVSYASSGVGTPGHIGGAYFARHAGLSMVHIPYKGAGEAMRDLLAGQVQLIITSPPSVMQFVRQGRAKALALTTAEPSRLVPGVPGAREAGLKDFNFDGWYGVWAPAGTPPAIVSRLHAAFNKALAEPAIVEKLEAQGAQPDPLPSPEAFAQFVRDDAKAMYTIVKQSGASIN